MFVSIIYYGFGKINVNFLLEKQKVASCFSRAWKITPNVVMLNCSFSVHTVDLCYTLVWALFPFLCEETLPGRSLKRSFGHGCCRSSPQCLAHYFQGLNHSDDLRVCPSGVFSRAKLPCFPILSVDDLSHFCVYVLPR